MHSHMAYISNMINEQAWGEATNEDQCKTPDVQETKHRLLLFCTIWIILQNSEFSLQPLPSSSDTCQTDFCTNTDANWQRATIWDRIKHRSPRKATYILHET